MLESSERYLVKFGLNLSRLRQENGFTQRDIEIFGITRAYYGKVELGMHALTVDKLFLLSNAFGISIDKFFLDENGDPI